MFINQQSNSVTSPCAVCRWPVPPTQPCQTCGWVADGSDGRALACAQYAWDLMAARRACDGDPTGLQRMQPWLRGEPAEADTEADAAGAASPRLTPPWSGEPPTSLTVLELSADHLEVAQLVQDGTGPPRLATLQRMSWAQLLPSQADDPSRLRFHLAGGVGSDDVDPVKLRIEARDNLPSRLAGKPQYILATPTAWALLRRLAEMAAGRYAAEVWLGGGRRELLRLVGGQRPITRPYHLALSRFGAAGQTEMTTVELFATGAVPGDATVVTLGVPGPAPADLPRSVALPVVTGLDDITGDLLAPHEWTAVRVDSASLKPGDLVTVTARLDDDGQVRFDGVGEVVEDPRSWVELLGMLPPAPSPTDLVLAVEHSGKDSAPARLAYAQRVLAEIDERVPGLVRVLLVGYGQHSRNRHESRTDTPVQVAEDPAPSEAGRRLAGWPVQDNLDDHAAALEDALDAIRRIQWRPDARRVAVFLGTKPPYPVRQTPFDPAVPCPLGLNWEQLVQQLRQEGVQMVVVRGKPRWGGHSRVRAALHERTMAWQSLATHGDHDMDRTSPRDLVDLAALVGDAPSTSPFALLPPDDVTHSSGGGTT
ncbi:hypothetical protein ACFPIJ_43370 [Dactylosporangium cerinum]|uniref:VWFA domain-containing protein n=1 Tax=Dactylosporangium cerinum TaxID=1434730 RepID=A0ABV9W8J3_9ACTN